MEVVSGDQALGDDARMSAALVGVVEHLPPERQVRVVASALALVVARGAVEGRLVEASRAACGYVHDGATIAYLVERAGAGRA